MEQLKAALQQEIEHDVFWECVTPGERDPRTCWYYIKVVAKHSGFSSLAIADVRLIHLTKAVESLKQQTVEDLVVQIELHDSYKNQVEMEAFGGPEITEEISQEEGNGIWQH